MRTFIPFVLLISLFVSCSTSKRTVLRSPSHSPVSTNKGRASTTSLNYIEQYKGLAIQEMNQYGIPASIKLAQAILESGSGNSYLAKEANNHFGIKCGGVWKGRTIRRSDDKPDDCFRVYRKVEDSYRDHSEFLLRKRYEKLFSLRRDDYKGWAKGLKDAGYATNPRYPELLIDLIERYELYQYDRKETSIGKELRERKIEHVIEDKSKREVAVQAEDIKAPVEMIVHEVQASQTLYGISKQYDVSIEQIKNLNNLSSENLSIGQLLLIKK